MFKPAKIISSGVNVPEPEYFYCDITLEAPAGVALISTPEDGVLMKGEGIKPFAILAKETKRGESEALCYRVTPNIVFETILHGNPKYLYSGARVKIYADSNECLCGVTDNIEDGLATIYDLCDATKSGDKVLVYFE